MYTLQVNFDGGRFLVINGVDMLNVPGLLQVFLSGKKSIGFHDGGEFYVVTGFCVVPEPDDVKKVPAPEKHDH